MAAVADVRGEDVGSRNLDSKSKTVSEFDMEKLVDLFSKLNPSAKEFFPSYTHLDHPHQGYFYHQNDQQFLDNYFTFAENSWADDSPSNRRRRNNSNQGRRRLNGRSLRAQREDSVRRTVYVSDIDQQVTEERLAALFSNCGQVIDCRICGDPHSVLRFAFVEFSDEYGAREALNLGGTMLGYYPVRVLPSKTAILPVNPSFLPRSDDEREMCSRTIYCTNIDKKISQAEVKNFFEAACGEVARLRLLGDQAHSTRIAFVEFTMVSGFSCIKFCLEITRSSFPELFFKEAPNTKSMLNDFDESQNDSYCFLEQAESAILALNCSGLVLGSQPIRVSPSKTPVRPRMSRPAALTC